MEFMNKFYKSIAVVAIAAAAGFTAYSTQGNKLHLSSLAIENVEALARGESGNFDCIPPYEKYTCVYIGSTRLPGIKYNH